MGNVLFQAVSKPPARKILQGPGATTSFQGLHGHNPTLGPICRRVYFNSVPLGAPLEPADRTYLVTRRQLECEAGWLGIHL